jgi:hypothetical protein
MIYINTESRKELIQMTSYFIHWNFCSFIIRGSRFLISNILQFAIDGKYNSKTKVENLFFFIFMSSYAEMSFLK